MFKLKCQETPVRCKDKIAQSLLEMMEELPYDSITIVDLCKNAGVSRKTYYRNYYQKFDVLIYIWDLMRIDFFQKLQIDENKGSWNIVNHSQLHTFFSYWYEQRCIFTIMKKTISNTTF